MPNALSLIAGTSSDAALLTSISQGQVASAPLTSSTPQTAAVNVSEDFFKASSLSSSQFNTYFGSVVSDLIRLFAATNDSDHQITALESLGISSLANITSDLDLLEARIQATVDLQLGYNAGYSIYSRVNFFDSSSIEMNPAIIGGFPQANYDPELQALTLGVYEETDTLHVSSGSTVVDLSIDLQIGQPIASYANLRSPAYAVDTSQTTYWAEVILTDEPVSVPWPPPQSKYLPGVSKGVIKSLNAGAVCEFTIDYRQPTSWNSIVLKPFCQLPINLAAVFTVKRDGGPVNPGETRIGDGTRTGYGLYLLTEYSSQRVNGNLFINETARLFYPIQEESLSVTFVFHQPHYVREVFALPLNDLNQQALWQQMLGNTPLLGIPQALMGAATEPQLNLTFTNQPTDVIGQLASAIGSDLTGTYTDGAPATLNTYVKYQYVYGAYNIEVNDRRYVTQSTFISTPLSSTLNILQGTLVADQDLPMVTTATAPASAFAGNPALVPAGFQVPAATITYDMTFDAGQPYYPVAPLDATLIHEPLFTVVQTSASTLRLQARPGSSVFLTSFDGSGGATVIGAVIAPAVNSTDPTSVVWPNAILSAPGFYIISYTPIDSSHYVDFGSIAEAAIGSVQRTAVITGTDIPQLSGFTLPTVPYIDQNRINGGFEPNGNPITEYVPISVSITGMPIVFPDIVDSSGHARTISSFAQETTHTQSFYSSVNVNLETLYSSTGSPTAATLFTAQHDNWDTSADHAPQLFSIAVGVSPVEIPMTDATGKTIWTADFGRGTIQFVGSNAATSGQISLTYWYEQPQFSSPCIVDRTNFSSNAGVSLTAFDATVYPIIEYILIGGQMYFNLELPAAAVATVTYQRLFDTVRVRANFARVDPINESATGHLYGYTFLARDANGTSPDVIAQQEVVWGDLELESLGSTTQNNPGVGVITGNSQSLEGLPAYTQFNWYRIVNAGSATDTLRASYDASNGTSVFWDFTNARYIIPDGGVSRDLTYQIMNIDGSNTITLTPGESATVGICNFLVPPNTPQAINPATIYSGQNADYLETEDWLFQAKTVTQATSVAVVVIS